MLGPAHRRGDRPIKSAESALTVEASGRGSPAQARKVDKAQRDLDALAHLLDETFALPGTGWRFGLEAIIGLVPVVGDLVSAGLGGLLIVRALQFGLPRIVVARMAFNTLLDLAVGAIPFIGDLFDFVYKSNRRNIDLFRRYAGEPGRSTRSEWLFFAALVFGAIAAVWLMVIAVGWLIGQVAAAF
ncbi:MAG: DUF4112 domain-containing protein [Chloroflexota bacterium]|nr:DUF4112 domain-containing protein [Chloroflexota bacterium]